MSLDRRSFLLAGLCAVPGLSAAETRLRRVACFSCGGTRLAPALARLGWKTGQDLRIEPRALAESPAQAEVDAAAREVVAGAPDVIVTFMREQVGALVRATRTIPVVAALHDPVMEGFARSLGRPGGNVTGIAFNSPESTKMTFRLLGATLPRLKRLHMLEPPGWLLAPTVKAVRAEITSEKGYAFDRHPVDGTAAAVRVLEAIRDPREEALVMAVSPHGFDHAGFAARILRARVAAIDMTGKLGAATLLAADLRHLDMWTRLAALVDQVLRGADPAVIPFEQPTHLEVILNRRVASAIGLTFPPDVMMRATKVIE
jgi:putative ABC transport system substrate-binding protein